MNHIPAKVTEIERHEGITIVTFSAAEEVMRMMALELDHSIMPETGVILSVKASNISLGIAPVGELSISNQLKATITKIDNGKVLSSVKFRTGETELESIITRESAERMRLKAGDSVIAMIKSSELSIVERL